MAAWIWVNWAPLPARPTVKMLAAERGARRTTPNTARRERESNTGVPPGTDATSRGFARNAESGVLKKAPDRRRKATLSDSDCEKQSPRRAWTRARNDPSSLRTLLGLRRWYFI